MFPKEPLMPFLSKTIALAVLAAVMAVATTVPAAEAARDRKAPRIVAASVVDADRDTRADRLRLTYSERVRHARDADRRYPFSVAGYRVRSVAVARGTTVVLTLVERTVADPDARPAVVYRRTRSRPVRDRAGNQARRETFRSTRPHGNRRATLPTLPTDPTGPGQTPDPRTPDPVTPAAYCAMGIRPDVPDLPDLAFTDSNCDGIDGTETRAVFASPLGDDANPGTKAAPKREIDAAVVAAAATGRYVLAAEGVYKRVTAVTGIGIYGGYDPRTWSRSATRTTLIAGSPEAVFAENATGVVLELLSVRASTTQIGVPSGATFYGIRAIDGSGLTLRRVAVGARNGAPGDSGSTGAPGADGGDGADGGNGQCDGSKRGAGGAGGDSPSGRVGGAGGRGGGDKFGIGARSDPGLPGVEGSLGGAFANGGDPGRTGGDGGPGSGGVAGGNGAGGSNSLAAAGRVWVPQAGADGQAGLPGHGGGGGGGGGGQVCTFCNNGSGNGGGGGGGGGEGGLPGQRGGAGGGSFGLYLHSSTATVSDGSTISAGDGGAGGAGGNGGLGGYGGDPGVGSDYCKDELGIGGDGGPGGPGGGGGAGGGGAGGPSVGIVRAGLSRVTVSGGATVSSGAAGAGGAGGTSGSSEPGQAGTPGEAQPIYPAA
jgi:hypothetical protein